MGIDWIANNEALITKIAIVIGVILLIMAGFFAIILNVMTFMLTLAGGPFESFHNKGSLVLLFSFATVGLPGIILGTLFGIITFQYVDW